MLRTLFVFVLNHLLWFVRCSVLNRVQRRHDDSELGFRTIHSYRTSIFST